MRIFKKYFLDGLEFILYSNTLNIILYKYYLSFYYIYINIFEIGGILFYW